MMHQQGQVTGIPMMGQTPQSLPSLEELKSTMLKTLQHDESVETGKETVKRLLKRQSTELLVVAQYPELWAKFYAKLEDRHYFSGIERNSPQHAQRLQSAMIRFAASVSSSRH